MVWLFEVPPLPVKVFKVFIRCGLGLDLGVSGGSFWGKSPILRVHLS